VVQLFFPDVSDNASEVHFSKWSQLMANLEK
jgi:hypothetical protein